MTCLRPHCRGKLFTDPDDRDLLRCTSCSRAFLVALGAIIEVVPAMGDKPERPHGPRAWRIHDWKTTWRRR